MTTKRLLHLCAFVFAFVAWGLWPTVASAFPNGVTTGTFAANGDPTLTVGCNNTGCHGCTAPACASAGGLGPDPSNVQVSVNGAAFTTLSGGTFLIPPTALSTFAVRFTSQGGAGGALGGFLVFHHDGSINDNNGTLSAGTGSYACPGGAGCFDPVTGNNHEVTHTVPYSGPTATVNFSYTPPAGCPTGGSFPLRIWLNGVNGDGLCQRPDRAAPFDFSVQTSCSDGNICTADNCGGGACSHPATNPCSDGDPCTIDTCPVNACVFTAMNCNDFDACTTDSCSGGVCQHPQINCSDSNACTTDSCSGGVCGHVSTCLLGDQCLNDSVCVPASGCQARTAKTGAACNADSNACTNPDTCSAGGACQIGAAVTCSPIDACHSVGSCVPASGCPAQVPLTGPQCGGVATCVGNVLHPHDLCNTGACQVQPTVNCNGTCVSAPTAHCTGSCTSDNDCLAGNFCNNTGNCVPQITQGNACNLAFDCLAAGTCRECATNNCVDGICCNTACAGGASDCLACNVPGSLGLCSNRPLGSGCNDGTLCTTVDTCSAGTCVGSSPVVCTAQDSCHVAGVCAGATGTCSNPAKATGSSCSAPVCADAFNLTAGGTCSAAATCQPGPTTSCAPNKCGAGACTTGCSTDANCAPTAYCDTAVVGGQCKTKQVPGATCKPGADDSCQSNHCVDGVCCDLACTGQCEACDIATKVGTCSPTTGAPHGGRGACNTDGTACGGSCSGNAADRGTCIYPQTSCRNASCTNGTATAGATCSGGSCPAVVTQACVPYLCGATQCNGDCTVDTDCTTGNWCKLGVCNPLLKKGDLCTGDNQCATTHCVDHYCCDAACAGQCQACDVNGSAGTCSTVMSGAPHGARFGCAGISMCQGSCNGTSPIVCGFPGQSTQCTEPACLAGMATSEAVCNSAGSCTTTDTNPCSPYGCGPTKCRTACASTTDCAKGFQCIGVICIPADIDAGVPTDDAGEPADAGAAADVSVSDSGTDASVTPGADAAGRHADAGGDNTIDVTAVPNAEYDGGCGCTVPGQSGMGQRAWSLLAVAALASIAGRRRRTRRPNTNP